MFYSSLNYDGPRPKAFDTVFERYGQETLKMVRDYDEDLARFNKASLYIIGFGGCWAPAAQSVIQHQTVQVVKSQEIPGGPILRREYRHVDRLSFHTPRKDLRSARHTVIDLASY